MIFTLQSRTRSIPHLHRETFSSFKFRPAIRSIGCETTFLGRSLFRSSSSCRAVAPKKKNHSSRLPGRDASTGTEGNCFVCLDRRLSDTVRHDCGVCPIESEAPNWFSPPAFYTAVSWLLRYPESEANTATTKVHTVPTVLYLSSLHRYLRYSTAGMVRFLAPVARYCSVVWLASLARS